MTIHALEAGDPLTVDEVRKYPTAHQRCGTEFLVVVIILSIIAFSLVGRQEPLVMIASRILLIPVIAAVGYEILRFGARHRKNRLVKVLLYPGLLVQKITTKQPTDDMIEVAIVSMEEALVADGESIPEGSADFERRPDAPRTGSGRRWRRRLTDIRVPGRPTGPDPADRPATRAMSDLDAKLAEVAATVRRDPGRPVAARDLDRPGRDPPAGPGAVAPRAGRRGVPPAGGHPGRARPVRASCATPRTPTTRCARWRATRSSGSRPTRRASSRS